MKKYYFLLFSFLLVLSSCGLKQTGEQQVHIGQTQQTIQTEKQVQEVKKENKTKEQENKDSNLKNSSQTGSAGSNLTQKDQLVLKKIDSTIHDVGWYKVNCKKIFKTLEGQRQCELKQLREAGNACFDKRLGITLENVDKYFTKQRFDLLSDTVINQYKNICKNQLLQIRKQQEEIKIKNKKLEQANAELEQILKNFKLSDCEKYFKKPQNMPYRPEQMIVDPITQCKIQYAIQVKKDCSILPEKLQAQCEQAKKDIEIFKRMKMNYELYGKTSLFQEISNMIYKKYGIENNLSR